MKKTLTLAFLFFSICSMAQVNWAIKSIDKPTDLYTNADNSTDVTAQITFENKGATVLAGDTAILQFAILRKSTNQLIQIPLVYNILIPADMATGQTLQTNDITFKLNLGITGNNNDPISFIALSYLRNRTNPKVDSDSTNNIVAKDMSWKPLSRAGVATLTYDNNIAAYPNPANTELTVSLNYVQLASTTIELISLNGQTVLSTTASEGSFANNTLDVSNVEKGLYILRVTNGDQVSTTKVSIAH
jgi:hypothetical protein